MAEESLVLFVRVWEKNARWLLDTGKMKKYRQSWVSGQGWQQPGMMHRIVK